MKRKGLILISVFLAITLAVGIWLWAYPQQKSTASLPALASLSQMTEGEITDLLEGYRLEQLHAVWGEPDGALFGMFGEIWELDQVNLYVYYENSGTVELARIWPAE